MSQAEPIRFLLVDDVDDNLVALGALVARDGLVLDLARSGAEALELLLCHDYALALLDVQMPGMDGFELAELMRGTARTRHVPIIFVTADPHEAHREFQGYDAGAVDFLVKPLEPRILRHKVNTFYDLYDQKRQLRAKLGEVEQITARLTETLRLNETFVAALTHDLRNPLSAISFGLDVIDRQELAPVTRRVVSRVGASARRMAVMIDQLQDVAKARLGNGLHLERGPCDLEGVTREVARELQTARHGAQIAVSVAGDPRGTWDEVRVARVASNLIGNALVHGAREHPVQVRIDGADPATVVLEVWNGGAIASDVLESVFEPFRRGPDAPGRTGLGLGLYIVQQIVQAHGGQVRIDSAVERGTTIGVELPRGARPA